MKAYSEQLCRYVEFVVVWNGRDSLLGESAAYAQRIYPLARPHKNGELIDLSRSGVRYATTKPRWATCKACQKSRTVRPNEVRRGIVTCRTCRKAKQEAA